MKINYVVGDATSPQVEDGSPFIIVHVCNDVGAWGAGFVKAISAKWKEPERQYRSLGKAKRKLGYVQMVVVGSNQFVANLIGQRDTKPNKDGLPPVRYEAIEEGLKQVFKWAATIGASIHMPRIGCGLSGGKWSEIEKCIQNASEVTSINVPVIVYDFDDKSSKNFVKANLN